MKKIFYFPFTILLFLFMLSNCDKNGDNMTDDNNNDTLSPFILAKEYAGQLLLYYSNEFPAFESNGSVDVEVDREGHMEFSSGGLQYSGTSDNGQAKIKREGEIIMMPHGSAYIKDNEVYFDVNENSMVTEEMTVWYWSGDTWVQAISETISETWNGGLVFSLIEAVIDGSTIEVSTEMGTVRWTLVLVPVPD
jgi:hypothetical protein